MPAGIVDVTPSVLSLHGLTPRGCDGRVLGELFMQPTPVPVVSSRSLHSTSHKQHGLTVTLTKVDGHEYISALDVV